MTNPRNKNSKLRNQEDNVVPFQNRISLLYLAWSFIFGLFKAKYIGSKVL